MFTHPRTVLRAAAVLAGAGLALVPALAAAQDYPSRNVHVVVPFAAGGGLDTTVRLMAEGLSENLGQAIVVENMPGAGSIAGAQYVASSDPDGYTLLFVSDALVGASVLLLNPPFDVQEDFTPIALTTSLPIVIGAHVSTGFETLEDLVEHARQNPGDLSYASPGIGTPHHLAMESFLVAADLDIVHIPYGGSGPSVVDARAGHVPLLVAGINSATPLLEEGILVALAQTGATRASSLEDLPTVAESFEGVDVRIWNAFFGPADLPEAVVERLNEAIEYAVTQESFIEAVGRGGVVTEYAPPEALAELVAAEVEMRTQAIELLGLEMQ